MVRARRQFAGEVGAYRRRPSRSPTTGTEDPEDLQKQLLELIHDERVIGVDVCDARPDAACQHCGVPGGVRVLGLGSGPGADGENQKPNLHEWSTVATLPTGRVHVSVMPIAKPGTGIGLRDSAARPQLYRTARKQGANLLDRRFRILGGHGVRCADVRGEMGALRLESRIAQTAAAGRQSRAANSSRFSATCANWWAAWPTIGKTRQDSGPRSV